MKKLESAIIIITMLLSLTACVGNGTPSNNGGTPLQSESSNNTLSSSESSNNTPSSSENSNNAPSSSKNGNDSAGDKKDENQITFTEVIAVDNDECSIKINGIGADNFRGWFTLKAQLENKSTEKTYVFSVESAAINGVQCNPFFASEVAAGKKSNDEISFPDSDLEKNGVGDYTDIELTFHVYDSNDWMADPVVKETIHIYPYGEDKAVRYVRESQSGDNIIIDNDYVTVIATGYEKGKDEIWGYWGYTVNLFLLNKTDKDVTFNADEVSINGFMADPDPFYIITVTAGKCAFSAMSWSNSTLEDNGITAVEEIEFKMRAYDSDNWYWFDNDFANEVITLKP